MKSTYKLLGTFWDGRDVLEHPIAEYRGVEAIRDYKEEYDLFDTQEYVRSVKVSEILRQDAGEKILFILERIRHCSKIVLVLDCCIQNRNPVIRKFLSKRISQCLRYIQDCLVDESVEIYIQTKQGGAYGF